MSRGQLFSIEALFSLLIILVFTILTLNLYSNFPPGLLEYEDLAWSINYAILKMDENGFLDKFSSSGNWDLLYDSLLKLHPQYKIKVEVYGEDFSVIYRRGCCDNVFKVISYIYVSNSLSFYGIKVYIGG